MNFYIVISFVVSNYIGLRSVLISRKMITKMATKELFRTIIYIAFINIKEVLV